MHDPGRYRICVAGRLGPEWLDRLRGSELVVRGGGWQTTVTELTGTLDDQAALQGLLDSLYARGCVLMSVELMGNEAGSNTTRREGGP
jgi:hypothetical protein